MSCASLECKTRGPCILDVKSQWLHLNMGGCFTISKSKCLPYIYFLFWFPSILLLETLPYGSEDSSCNCQDSAWLQACRISCSSMWCTWLMIENLEYLTFWFNCHFDNSSTMNWSIFSAHYLQKSISFVLSSSST